MKAITRMNIARCGTALLLGVSVAAHAARTDDTEIYLDSGSAFSADPIVMFYTQYTPQLASTVCNGISTADTTTTGLQSALATTCPTLASLSNYFVYPDSSGASSSNNDFLDGTIDRYELIRAVLKRVVIGLGDMKVGVLTAHDNNNNCVGPSASSCSNGAYILHRAVSLSNVTTILTAAGITASFDATNTTHRDAVLNADANKQALFTKLNGVPSPQGNLSHANQDKEVYFELFRYLTGKPVFNGHNGYTDYASVTSKNLGSAADTFTYKPAGGLSFNLNTANLGWDTAAESGNVYISPIDTHCQRIFVINVVYGGGNSADDSDSYITQSFSSDGMNMSVSKQDAGFVQMVRNLRDYDLADGNINPLLTFADNQNVTSFFLAEQTSQVDAAADAGGTGRAIQLEDDPAYLVTEMQKIFNQILSVSTTFVAASIPVNVFNRSEVIDNAYIALFQADANSKPAWMGDVKKLKLDIYVQSNPDGSTTNKLQFIDATGTEAIATDGRIDAYALTFWTNASGYDITDTEDVTGNDPDIVAGKDGRAVTRGGAGQKIPGFLSGNAQGSGSWTNSATGRRLFTEATATVEESDYLSTGSGLMDIEYANAEYLWSSIYDNNTELWPTLSSSYTGSYATDQNINWTTGCYSFYSDVSSGYWSQSLCYVYDIVSNIFAYMRGYDVNASTNTERDKTRRWLMGDPLHSRPLPINYGTRTGYSADNSATSVDETNPDIRIIVGSNDGYLRMLKNTSTGTQQTATELGEEVWAFMPREVMNIQKQLMDNNIVSSTSTLPEHAYGVDGSPVAYVKDGDGTIGTCTEVGAASPCDDQVMVYFGLRRGGRAYYALDITSPDAPQFKWKITHENADFTELGYTFSQPVVRHINWGEGMKPVLIFAGGHDLDKDVIGHGSYDDATTASMGNAIYIVDAIDGTLIWKVNGGASDSSYSTSTKSITRSAMVDGIPSEVTATDGNGDGQVDRIYVGDTGGKVWRIDLPNQPEPDATGSDPRASWNATVLMNLGRHWNDDSSAPSGSYPNDRRFFTAPDVVPTTDDLGNYDAIVIGSGNREHPLATLNEDYMYMYKDRCTSGVLATSCGFTAAITPDDLADLTTNCAQTDSCTSSVLTDLETGWKLQLTDSGEKSLAAALTLRGVVYFSTYVPATTVSSSSTDQCKPEGKGYFYAISLADATSVFSYFSSENETADESLTTEDRKRELASGGIPAENVYVSFRKGDLTYTGILPSDLDATADLGTMEWRSFWYEKQR